VTAPGCHVERVAGVPVLVSGELTPEDRAEVEDFAALLRELGTAQAAPEVHVWTVQPTSSAVIQANRGRIGRAARRLGEPCDQCAGFSREHTDDCPEAGAQ
jgi:hypothetical protein